MVIARNTGSRAEGFKTRFNNYLTDFGTKVTLYKSVETLDSQGRVTAVTETSSTIMADIQYVTKQDIMHLNVGGVEVGDGMIFVKQNANISLHDDVEFNSVRWKVTNQIEGELVTGELVYNGYFIRKND